jgi:hypothetical protein
MKKLKIAVLLAMLLLSVAASGCISSDEEKELPDIEIIFLSKSHKVYAGDSTTYILIVNNNREENDTVTLSVDDVPSGWEATLNLTKFNMTTRSTFGIFLMVNASQDAKTGDYKVKITVTSDIDGKKHSKSITTKVIKAEGDLALEDDKVEVNYIGYLGEYKIFDTSISDIGKSSAVLKTPDFKPSKVFQPLNVQLGATDPDETDEYSTTVEGFWEAIAGMKEGQSRTVFIPPSKGYGVYENASINVTEEVTMVETISFMDFSYNFPGEQPSEGTTMTHYFWGWNVSIDYVNQSEDIIRMFNEPELNQSISPFGWSSEVTYKNRSDNDGEGLILVKHEATAGMKAIYLGLDAEVKSVEEGQIHLKYNSSSHSLGHEVLIFDITLEKIID